MFIKVLIFILITLVGLYCTHKQYEKKNIKGIIYLILGTIAINIIASLIYDFVVGPYFFDSAVPVSSDLSVNCDANVNNPGNETIQLDSITTKDTEDAIITSGEDSLSFEDISEEILVRGSIVNEDQKNSYK